MSIVHWPACKAEALKQNINLRDPVIGQREMARFELQRSEFIESQSSVHLGSRL
jgi:hypothetical protein